METLVHEETRNGHTIKIYIDQDAENPRDWDNLGTLICGHSRYQLGDQHHFAGGRDSFSTFSNLMALLSLTSISFSSGPKKLLSSCRSISATIQVSP